MRTRVVQLAVAGAVLVGLFVLPACAGQSSGAGTALATKSVTVGAVEVKVEPVKVDASGAEFKVFFDGHSFDLGLDPARSASLNVAGQGWPVARWSGDPAGGHHCLPSPVPDEVTVSGTHHLQKAAQPISTGCAAYLAESFSKAERQSAEQKW